MLYPGFLNEDFYNNIFDEMLDLPFSYGKRVRNEVLPKRKGTTDILEYEDKYVLEMELPGYNKEEIKAELKNGYLIVSAEHGKAEETKKDSDVEQSKTAEASETDSEVVQEEPEKKEFTEPRYICRERFYGKTERSFFVGKELSKEDIKAQFINGVLTLTFPKTVKKPEKEREFISILDE